MQIGFYKETVESDYEMISRILLPVTAKQIRTLKQTHMEKYLRYYVQHRLAQFTKKGRSSAEVSFRFPTFRARRRPYRPSCCDT